MSRKIRICFYQPCDVNEHPLNRIAAYISAKIEGSYAYYVSHCEILFEDDFACSIYDGQSVFFRKRSFENPNYIVKSFAVPNNSYDNMYRYCRDMASYDIEFSNTRMMCGPLFGLFRGSKGTFCSEVVVKTLQRGDVSFVRNVDPFRCSPARLLALMMKSECICFDVTPFVESRLLY